MKGQFIIIDGIAGSGKTTILNYLKEYFEKKDLQIFDQLDWTKNNEEPPVFEDAVDADILFTFEPTKQWIGKAIRNEMSRTDALYFGIDLAQAFALDRLIQYRRLIVPALKAGKIIIQDRGFTTSFIYQPIMHESISLEEIKNLSGNKFALKHAPDHLILTQIEPEKIKERLNREEESKGVFENIDFMKEVNKRYKEDWFTELMDKHETKIHNIQTGGTLQTSKENIINLISQITNI